MTAIIYLLIYLFDWCMLVSSSCRCGNVCQQSADGGPNKLSQGDPWFTAVGFYTTVFPIEKMNVDNNFLLSKSRILYPYALACQKWSIY